MTSCPSLRVAPSGGARILTCGIPASSRNVNFADELTWLKYESVKVTFRLCIPSVSKRRGNLIKGSKLDPTSAFATTLPSSSYLTDLTSFPTVNSICGRNDGEVAVPPCDGESIFSVGLTKRPGVISNLHSSDRASGRGSGRNAPVPRNFLIGSPLSSSTPITFQKIDSFSSSIFIGSIKSGSLRIE